MLVAQADRIGAVARLASPGTTISTPIVMHALNWERRLSSGAHLPRRSQSQDVRGARVIVTQEFARPFSLLAVRGTAGGCLIQLSTWAHLNALRVR